MRAARSPGVAEVKASTQHPARVGAGSALGRLAVCVQAGGRLAARLLPSRRKHTSLLSH